MRAKEIIVSELALQESGLPQRIRIIESKQTMFKPSGVRTVNNILPDGQGNVSVVTGTGGNTRIITTLTSNTNAGNVANTDYIYLCNGTFTVTLPTALTNTNRYTVKNIGTGTITVATTGGQTIDGGSTAQEIVQYTSIDIISDGTNWDVI